MNMVIETLGRCSVRDKDKEIHKFDLPQTSTSFSYKYELVKQEAPKTGYTAKNHVKHVAPVKSDSLTYTLENGTKTVYLQSPLATWNVKVDGKYSKEEKARNAELKDKVDLSNCKKVILAFSIVYRGAK
jgi:hypothetical protein